MDVVEGIPEEFTLLRQELARVSDSRFARGLVHPLKAVLSLSMLALMCGQCSLSAIYRLGDTHPELLAGLGLMRSPSVATLSRLLRMVKVAEVRQAMLNFMVALSRMRGAQLTVASVDGKTIRGVWEDGEQLRPSTGSGVACVQPSGRLGIGPNADIRASGRASGRPGVDGAGFRQR